VTSTDSNLKGRKIKTAQNQNVPKADTIKKNKNKIKTEYTNGQSRELAPRSQFVS
jgi:hypothetical protein